MLFACAVVAVCAASNAVVSAYTPPPVPEIRYIYDENVQSAFSEFIKMYERKYSNLEYHQRFAIFKQNVLMMNRGNFLNFGKVAFWITEFADMTAEEQHNYFGFKPYNQTVVQEINESESEPLEYLGDAPEQFDWRDRGVVTPPKKQGACASCYVFSAIGNIESQYAIKYNQCITFSEQQGLDCLKDIGGCKSGYPHEVMQKLSQRLGCMKEEDYPFVENDGQQCKEIANKTIAKVTGGQVLNISDEKTLKQKLYETGPLVVGVDASDFCLYAGGILKPYYCSSHPKRANHAVLLVGYGEEGGVQYWSIKNSFGIESGELGYVRLLRGVNACGIATNYVATAQVA